MSVIRRWVAAHMCVLSHFRTCDVRAEVRAERHWKSACVVGACGHILTCDFAIALFHLFNDSFVTFSETRFPQLYFELYYIFVAQ